MTSSYIGRFRDLTSGDVQRVGGKNASLGKLDPRAAPGS